MNDRNKEVKKYFLKYREYLEEESDLYANKPPSFLFPILMKYFGYLLEDNPETTVTNFGVKIRKPMHHIIQLFGPLFLSSKHMIENRKQLEDTLSNEKDSPIVLPKDPVIWAPSHMYQEDPIATLLSVKRSSYVLIGNPPRTFNDLAGIPALINGAVLVNRRNKKSRQSSIAKCERVLELGSDLVLFPEGIGNKTPNCLSLHLFPGIYKIANEKKVKIVPIVHYKDESKNIIHTVIDDPIDPLSMTKEELLTTLRDTYAYWKYLMMEKYGKTTRQELVGKELDINSYWEKEIQKNHSDRYDLNAEKSTTYYTQREREYFKAIDDIASLEITPENYLIVEDAKKLVKSQFQRRL